MEGQTGANVTSKLLIARAYEWYYYDVFGGNDFYFVTIGLTLYTLIVFWTIGGAFLLVDVFQPPFLAKYKTQPAKNAPLELGELWKATKRALFNMIVIGVPFQACTYMIGKWRGIKYESEYYPTASECVYDAVVILLCEEFLFYYSHKLFHDVPYLYKSIHKVHHTMTAPFAITCVYAHAIEHIISNAGAIALGPLVSNAHGIVWFVWVTIALTATLIAHSGYHMPFLPSNEKHDFHHKTFNGNLGPLGILDTLHGTNMKFKKTVYYKRDRIFTSLSHSMREIYPDETKDD